MLNYYMQVTFSFLLKLKLISYFSGKKSLPQEKRARCLNFTNIKFLGFSWLKNNGLNSCNETRIRIKK